MPNPLAAATTALADAHAALEALEALEAPLEAARAAAHAALEALEAPLETARAADCFSLARALADALAALDDALAPVDIARAQSLADDCADVLA